MSDEQRGADDAIELGDVVEAKVTKGSASVVAVRVSPDLLARINDYGQKHGMNLSEVLRTGAERLIDQTVQLGPNFVSGVTVYGPTLMTGSSATGSGRSQEMPAMAAETPGQYGSGMND